MKHRNHLLVALVMCIGSTALAQALSPDKLPSVTQLPDPFVFNDGSRLKTPQDWSKRRAEIIEIIAQYEYGHLPPAPDKVEAVELISHNFMTPVQSVHKMVKLSFGPEGRKTSLVIDLLIPRGKGPFPVIVRGDWCWLKTPDPIAAEILKRGYILVDYNRCEIAPDIRGERGTGLYVSYPDGDFGAVAAWAYGFHRCVDFLMTQDYVDKAKIAVTGHSRGGKCVLLAGATDTRIALTMPNNSGCGGAGSLKFQAPKSEDAAAITRNFPYWFTPRFVEFVGKQDKLPLDQHFVKALVAPRALLTTEALGDLGANPEGTRQTHLAAREVFKFLGAADKIGIFFREGKHDHLLEDFQVQLDFADQLFFGKKSDRDFNPNPFPNTPKTFEWTMP